MQTIFNKYFPFNGEIIQQEDVGIREWVKTNRDFHIRGKILWKKKRVRENQRRWKFMWFLESEYYGEKWLEERVLYHGENLPTNIVGDRPTFSCCISLEFI